MTTEQKKIEKKENDDYIFYDTHNWFEEFMKERSDPIAFEPYNIWNRLICIYEHTKFYSALADCELICIDIKSRKGVIRTKTTFEKELLQQISLNKSICIGLAMVCFEKEPFSIEIE